MLVTQFEVLIHRLHHISMNVPENNYVICVLNFRKDKVEKEFNSHTRCIICGPVRKEKRSFFGYVCRKLKTSACFNRQYNIMVIFLQLPQRWKCQKEMGAVLFEKENVFQVHYSTVVWETFHQKWFIVRLQ